MSGLADIRTPPAPTNNHEFNQAWIDWLSIISRRFIEGPFLIKGYAVADLPSAADYSDGTYFSALVFVNDETGGATMAFSDGTNWRRVQDRAIVA